MTPAGAGSCSVGNGQLVDECIQQAQGFIKGNEVRSCGCREFRVAGAGALGELWVPEGGPPYRDTPGFSFCTQECSDKVAIKVWLLTQNDSDIEQVLRPDPIANALLQQGPQLLGHNILDRGHAKVQAWTHFVKRRSANRLIDTDVKVDPLVNHFPLCQSLAMTGLIGLGVLDAGLKRHEGLAFTGRLWFNP